MAWLRRGNVLLATGIVVILVAGLGWYGISHATAPRSSVAAPLTNGALYRDPDNYFTIEIPAGWQVMREVSSATPSSKGEMFHIATIWTTFAPHDPVGATDPVVTIYLESANDAGSRKWACIAHNDPPTTTIAGLPASQDFASQWEVNAQNAHFQLDYSVIPRQGGRITVAPTPLPATEVKSRTALLASVIASFTPTPDQPLTC